ncbi:MAG: C40 family peptidase [Gemmatimonadetes bacterium]|nr:C40 family peptidase [Gemmatimonadota bacterium]
MLHPTPEQHQVLRTAWLAVVGLWGTASSVGAQARGLDVTYGTWRHDTLATVWTTGYFAPLLGPLDYGLALSHLDDRRSPSNRTQTGADVSVGIGRDGKGLYVVSHAGLGLRHDDGSLDAQWSAGAGAAARLLPFLSIGIEGRFQSEDQFLRGFWRLDPTDRTGWVVAGRVALLFGSGAPRRRPSFNPPSEGDIRRAARDGGASKSASELAANIVSTALDAMGTPYRWGGEGSNGYDCSGLIQYAYGQHGIILPRVSREQVVMGTAVERHIEALVPGDILGFSVEGDRVTHVGLYVGEGQFIHSASDGVKLSSLSATDPDSLWWRHRWTVVRRILR